MTLDAAKAAAAFGGRFGVDPAVVVRAPGRVNVIGEHTDYSLLPVLPMAIQRSLSIAVGAAGDGVVRIASEAFDGEVTIDLGRRPPRHEGPGWGRYAAAAVQELLEARHSPSPASLERVPGGEGATILVIGDLPGAAGLSSSSALTLGLMAALNASWHLELTIEDLVRRAAAAERRAGIEIGGMDQEAIAFAVAGSALRVDFEPPGRRPVPIPEGLRFVVAHSGEEAPKAGSARDAYNERVLGARLGAGLLAEMLGVESSTPPVLRDVAGVDAAWLLAEELPARASIREVARSAGLDAADLGMLTSGPFDNQRKVPIAGVAQHVLAEAERVDAAEAALLAGELEAFGALLNDSHQSLRDLFRCSTPALDRVCAAMRKAGAYGARLTGAGFGGFAVAAVAPERLEAVVGAATDATGGPAFEAVASPGLEVTQL